MWPFKKKTKEEENNQSWEKEKDLRIKEIESEFPIGKRFRYLGVDMIVSGHHQFWPYVGKIPGVNAQYADAHGVIKKIEFGYVEYKALKAEVERC